MPKMLDKIRNALIKRPINRLLGRRGATGTQLWRGYLFEEYQSELANFKRRLEIYEQMRADGGVSALLSVIGLPIRAADFMVKGEDAEQVAFVEETLEGLGSFDELLRQILLMLDYGVVLFEKMFAVRDDGMLTLTGLEWRHPRTIERWLTYEDGGGLRAVVQRTYGDTGKDEVEIPAEKLARFTYRQVGDNFEGRAILRDAYKHWWYKDALYRLSAIASERLGVGIPILKTPRRIGEREQEEALETLRRMRANRESGIQCPDDYQFEMLTAGGFENFDLIEHHDSQIARVGLAQFLVLGLGSRGGSFALSESHLRLFQVSLESLLRFVCGTFTDQVITPLLLWNFGKAEAHLEGALRPIDRDYFGQFAYAAEAEEPRERA